MKVHRNPPRSMWSEIAKRPTASSNSEIHEIVRGILNEVRSGGDEVLMHYSRLFDNVQQNKLTVNTLGATDAIPPELKSAINVAYRNIEAFHASQKLAKEIIQIQPGVECWRESRPIDPVGLYVPGGSAPLFSSLLMLGIPARLAGCSKIIVCTPPDSNGSVSPVIRYTASLLGIDTIYAVGGAQAIGAMAFGTETVPRVHKIFGPGNAYVTAAKLQIQSEGIPIDMPAGPSEVLVIADETCDPQFVASDLISQAEHGPDSQVMLVSTSETIVTATMQALDGQLSSLPRKDIAMKSLAHSKAIVVNSLSEAVAFSNEYAPEHLIINTADPDSLLPEIKSAGSVFLGQWSCESLGDYASGTNHTLPTAGFAKSYSGVSLDRFVKKVTIQRIDQTGIRSLGPSVEVMARAEGLAGHERAVSIRLKKLGYD